MLINFNLVYQFLPFLLHGALITISIAVFSCIIGFAVGLILALFQVSGIKLFTIPTAIYVHIIRATPKLVQIALFYYVIAPSMGLDLTPIGGAIMAIGLTSSAYISQIIRMGILSLDKGQIDAARTLGFSRMKILHHIILPKTIRIIIPSIGNELVVLVKDSSLAYTIGVTELYRQGFFMRNVTLDAITAYTSVAFFYLIINSILLFGLYYIEKRTNIDVED